MRLVYTLVSSPSFPRKWKMKLETYVLWGCTWFTPHFNKDISNGDQVCCFIAGLTQSLLRGFIKVLINILHKRTVVPFPRILKDMYFLPPPAPYIPGRSICTLYHLVISNLPQLGTFSLLQLQKILEWWISFLLYQKHLKIRNSSSKTNIIRIQSNQLLFPGLLKIFVRSYRHCNWVQVFYLLKLNTASLHIMNSKHIPFLANSITI